MSRTRNPKQDDWRRKLYQNQKRTKAFKTSPTFRQTDAEFKSGWFTTFVLLNIMFNGAAALSLRSNTPVAKLARSKMQIDPALTAAEQKAIDCEVVVSTIDNMAEKNAVAKALATQVMSKPNFKLFCTSYKSIKAKPSSASAFFTLDDDSMHIAADAACPSLTHHEFIHAGWYYAHDKTSSCETDNPYHKILPLKNHDHKSIDAYEKALLLGDARVDQYYELAIRKQQGDKLSAKESSLLNQYNQAAKNCLPGLSTFSVPPEIEAEFNKQTKLNKPTRLSMLGSEVILIHVYKSNGKTIGMGKVSDAFFNMRGNLDTYRRLLPKFPNKFVQIAEHDAYAFMGLDLKAIKTFYPEAMAMRDKVMETCKPEHRSRVEL